MPVSNLILMNQDTSPSFVMECETKHENEGTNLHCQKDPNAFTDWLKPVEKLSDYHYWSKAIAASCSEIC